MPCVIAFCVTWQASFLDLARMLREGGRLRATCGPERRVVNRIVNHFRPLLVILIISACSFLQACVTKPTPPANPWVTPNRGYVVSSPEENAKLLEFMRPCIAYARAGLADAYREFAENAPPQSIFSVVALSDLNATFYADVTSVHESYLLGRVLRGQRVQGRAYSSGDTIKLATADVIDWLISYPDRPERGNLLGKYMLMRQDGLMSGSCDPQHAEFQHFRLFRSDYSFVPPVGDRWQFGDEAADADVALISMDVKGPDEKNVILADRLRAQVFKTDQELIDKITEVQKKDVGDPERVILKQHKVTAYKQKNTRCVLSHRVFEDKLALLANAERGLMMREMLALACVHPAQQDTVVVLSYSHRYHPGYRDAAFEENAMAVFESLAFTVNK